MRSGEDPLLEPVFNPTLRKVSFLSYPILSIIFHIDTISCGSVHSATAERSTSSALWLVKEVTPTVTVVTP